MFARVIDGVAIVAHARAAILAVNALVWSGVVADDADTRAHELMVWAAYYFKVSNANPLTQYEDLYGTGERAFKGASQISGVPPSSA